MAEAFDPPDTGLVPVQPTTPAPAPKLVGQNTYSTSFQDETVRKYDFELYAGRAGQTDRIYLPRPDALLKSRIHYNDKTKYTICNSTYETHGTQELQVKEAQCCKLLGRSAVRFGALVVKYNTDRNGQLVKPFGYEMRFWKFGVDKYIILKAINLDFALNTHDLTVACTDAQYQKMTIGAKPDCLMLHPGFPPKDKASIDQWVVNSLPKLPGEMGRIMSDAELAKELGGATAAPTMTAADAPITNFDEIVGNTK